MTQKSNTNWIISFRGDRDTWIDFVSKVKKARKSIWDVLEPYIIKYGG